MKEGSRGGSLPRQGRELRKAKERAQGPSSRKQWFPFHLVEGRKGGLNGEERAMTSCWLKNQNDVKRKDDMASSILCPAV